MAGVTLHPGIRRRPPLTVIPALIVLLAAMPAVGDPGEFSGFSPSEKVAEPDPDLRAVLATADQDRLLRITLFSRVRLEGHPYLIEADTLLLIPPADYLDFRESGRAGGFLQAPLQEIALVQQRRSGAAQGGKWGLTAGGLAGSTLGVLLGLLVSGLNDSQDSDVQPVIALGLMGGGMGAAVGGGIGAGIGALTDSWYILHPGDDSLEPEPPVEPSAPIRFDFQTGYAMGESEGIRVSGLSLRCGLPRLLGARATLGPAIGYHHLTGTRSFSTPDYQGSASIGDPVVTVGLDLRIAGLGGRVRPFLDLGAGANIASDLYPGAHVGAGLIHAGAGGAAGYLGVRYHFNLHGDFDGGISDFWVIGAGLAFGPGRDE